MTTFAQDETSVQGSRPRDAYEFILPAVTYRLTSGVKDLVVNGQTYRAAVIGRAEVRPSTADESPGELEIMMNVSHALPQRWLRAGIPPRRIDVNVYRYQQTSGKYELTWTGRIAGMRCEKNNAVFLVVQRLSDAAPRRIPTITAGKECPHILFDGGCKAVRSAFKIDTTVASVNGREVSVVDPGPDLLTFGELVHVASGERMMITYQASNNTDIKIHLPIVDMQAGDAIELYPGCDRSTGTCLATFDNIANYGGFPFLPTKNPFIDNGLGIVEQE